MAQFQIEKNFQRAVQHHQAGQLEQAEQLYRQVLAERPAHFDALHNLGVLARQTGRSDVALELFRRAASVNPQHAEVRVSLGHVLSERGELDEAIAVYRQAIALRPNLPVAHFNIGNALKAQGKLVEAIAAYRQAIALRADVAEGHLGLANALKENGQLDEAIAGYRQAILLKPDFVEAHNNLGVALRGKGQLEEAVAAYRRAIVLKPDFAEAHANLGHVLEELGRREEAVAAFQRATEVNPTLAVAQVDLGNALKRGDRIDEAVAAYRRATALRPGYAEAHYNLGIALADQGQVDEAIAAYRQAITLNPSHANTHSIIIYLQLLSPAYDARAIAEELGRWNRQYTEPLRRFIRPHTNERSPERRLRIGYVSADFRVHASAHFLAPLLKHHDRQQVEIFCYGEIRRPDAMTQQFQEYADVWRNTVGLSDEQLANQISEDKIDILVDLKLHSGDNRLLVFARKPAPVQVTWLGYPGSTGLSTVDYRLSDPYLDPVEMDESVYSEKTIRLPETFWCFDPLDAREVSLNSLPAMESKIITFGSLNNFNKMNDSVLSLWAQVMKQVEHSRLLLMAPKGSPRERMLERLRQEGIDAERVEFVPRQPRRDYLETYHRIDVGLDPFPCNGHTTSLDSFWMGVPVVTLVGQRSFGRAGWCQLSNLGLPELAGETREQFVRIAAKLAGDLPRLSELRRTLRERMERSPLMDGAKFARNIETAYRQMWRTWCAKTAETA